MNKGHPKNCSAEFLTQLPFFWRAFFEDTHRWDRRYFCNPNNNSPSWNRPNDLPNTPIPSLALTGVALFFTVINEIWEKLVDHILPTRIFGWDSQIPFQGLGVTSDHVYFDGGHKRHQTWTSPLPGIDGPSSQCGVFTYTFTPLSYPHLKINRP